MHFTLFLLSSLALSILAFCLAFPSHATYLFQRLVLVVRPVPVIGIHTKDFGNLGVRVYVTDEELAMRVRRLTGNKTLTLRNVRALYAMGYRFALSGYEPMDVPVWLVGYVENGYVIEGEVVAA